MAKYSFVRASMYDVCKPWDAALRAILGGTGLDAVEDQHGILFINTIAAFAARPSLEENTTRSIILCCRRASVVAEMMRPRLPAGGVITADTQLNQIVLATKPSYMDGLVAFIRTQDIKSSPTAVPITPLPSCRPRAAGKTPQSAAHDSPRDQWYEPDARVDNAPDEDAGRDRDH